MTNQEIINHILPLVHEAQELDEESYNAWMEQVDGIVAFMRLCSIALHEFGRKGAAS